jgi:hypothetical protein
MILEEIDSEKKGGLHASKQIKINILRTINPLLIPDFYRF